MPDTSDFDGKQLLALFRSGNSPFHSVWDGFYLKLLNRPDIVARLARGDVNIPNFNGFSIHIQVPEVKFEVAVYELLRLEPNIIASHLLYYRILDITGRRLFLFERLAHIRVLLFNFNPPLDFTAIWLRERLFKQKPKSLPIPVAPTREFCFALFTNNITSLLRLIPYIIPTDSDEAFPYRLVLEHGDFGIYNILIIIDETGYIVPAILSDPLVSIEVDLVIDENIAPSFIRVPNDVTPDNRRGDDPEGYFSDLGAWAKRRIKELSINSVISQIVYDN
ncbi:3-hydroxybutyryl-CoA dehydratase [Hyaloscypha finlandica]|nr:3-hydroxybutyryl-CoA dehydratase [Hyaloscypha finlandica]